MLLVVAAFATVSCNKEKTCKCTTTLDGDVISETTLTTEEDCSDGNSETTLLGDVMKTNCVEQ
jgi:hypothetical protein